MGRATLADACLRGVMIVFQPHDLPRQHEIQYNDSANKAPASFMVRPPTSAKLKYQCHRKHLKSTQNPSASPLM
jgi:hypothetical protein